MPPQPSLDPSQFDDSLYTWWFKQLPPLFGGRSFAEGVDHAASEPASALGLASQATKLAEQTLVPLYETYHRMLTTNPPQQVLGALNQLIRGRIDQFTQSLGGLGSAFAAPSDATTALQGWATTPSALWGDALTPVSSNLERTYGGLADVFGLAPSRHLKDAARDMASAALAHKQAQAEYLRLIAGGFSKGAEAMMSRLAEMAQRGESVDSMLALVRLWAKATDEAVHDAMQAPPALAASAKLVRAAGKSRQQQQRIVAILSQALNIPTRQEVDEAYRAIQELKRELRRLRKGDALAAAVPAKPPARAARSPNRGGRSASKPPAKSSRTRAKGATR